MKRIWHHWERWECVPAGMYETTANVGSDEALEMYAVFLRDLSRFERALARVMSEWPISCEQFLSNESMNRIAWLGQASACIDMGIPSCFRAGFKRLTDAERNAANATADKALRRWEERARKDRSVSRHMEQARISGRYPGRSAVGANEPESCAIVQGYLFGDLEQRLPARIVGV